MVSICEARFWQKSPRFCQDPDRNRQDSDQLSSHIRAPRSLVECGGPRVSDLNPPHSAGSGGVCRPSVKNQGKNLPEQESCIPTGRAKAAALDHGLVLSPPFLPPFFRSIFGRHFFNFCAFLASPGDPKNHQKSPKIDFGSLPFSELMPFMLF